MRTSVFAFVALLVTAGFCSLPVNAQAPAAKVATPAAKTNWTPPKTSWGDPDLQGTWPISSLMSVPLQRPKQYGDRLNFTAEELDKQALVLDERWNEGGLRSRPPKMARSSRRQLMR